jgi:NitT/TauT family transport system permease protein
VAARIESGRAGERESGSGLAPARPAADYPLIVFVRDALPPVGLFVVFVAIWQVVVTALQVPRYILPTPLEIVGSLEGENGGILLGAMWVSFLSAICGYILAITVGLLAALIMTQNKILERSLYPYAIMLQTIPIVAIAPIIVIWTGTGKVPLGIGPLQIGEVISPVVIIAFIIALFPIISNATAGLTSTDHNLLTMFELYNANWWQRMWKLKLPAATPYIMTGLRISAGLAVIGAIVGEFIAGIGGSRGGLGYLIVSYANRLQMAPLFASALASSLLGIIIFIAVSQVSARFLRHWHESAVRREA